MTHRPWYLSRRVAVWFAVNALLLVTAVTGAGLWTTLRSIDRELDALAAEEINEVRLSFALSDGTREDFARIASELQEQHPHNPMAWRVWDPDGIVWSERGPHELLDDLPETPHAHPAEHSSWRTSVLELSPELTAAMAIDGSSQMRILGRLAETGLGMLLVTVVAASLIGNLLSRRVARHLTRIADSMRNLQGGTDLPPLDEALAPEEVRGVVEALREMLVNIEREIQNSRLLTSGLAHELRSPIQNVLGTAEVALLRPRSGDEYRDSLRRVIAELRDLARVVDNLVLLCSDPDHRRTRGRERFDLAQEVRLRLRRERTLARERSIELAIESPDALLFEGDREGILLALRNLVMNAIEWAGERGRVRLRIRPTPEGVELAVDDSGPGVPPEEREKIFQPFYQGRKVAGRRVGYGLGLALARTAVESHGGAIEVTTSELGGACFRARLPARPSADPPAHERPTLVAT